MEPSEDLCARVAPLFAQARYAQTSITDTLFQAAAAVAGVLQGEIIEDPAAASRFIAKQLAVETILTDYVFPRVIRDDLGRTYAGFFFKQNSVYASGVPNVHGDFTFKDGAGVERRGFVADSNIDGMTDAVLVPFEPAVKPLVTLPQAL